MTAQHAPGTESTPTLVVTFAEILAILAQSGHENCTAAHVLARGFADVPESIVPAGLASLRARGFLRSSEAEAIELEPRLAVLGYVLSSPDSWADVVVEWEDSTTLTHVWVNDAALAVLRPRELGTFDLQLLGPAKSVAPYVGAVSAVLLENSGAQVIRARLMRDDTRPVEARSSDDGAGWTVANRSGAWVVTDDQLVDAVQRATEEVLDR